MRGEQRSVEAEPKVVEYLRALDIALAQLPRDEAVELRQQIVDHLEESLGADADDQHIAETLQRLGLPEELVAETLGTRSRRAWPRLRSWGWRRWAIVAVVVALLGSGIGYVVDMADQPALEAGCAPCGWYYPKDAAHSREVGNLLGQEYFARDRPGQLQGFVFTVRNTSRWPETVLGANPQGSIGGPNTPTIAVGTVNAVTHGLFRRSPYRVGPVVIPPGETRYLRVTWRSARCQLSAGGSAGSASFSVRVKIGWFTHTQDLQPGLTFALTGVAEPSCT